MWILHNTEQKLKEKKSWREHDKEATGAEGRSSVEQSHLHGMRQVFKSIVNLNWLFGAQ